MVDSEDLDSLNYGFSEEDLESARDKPGVKLPVIVNNSFDNLNIKRLPPAGVGKPLPEIDIDSQYKIAKKKELIVKKLSQLKQSDAGQDDEVNKVLFNQVQDLLEDFEQEYRDTMSRELDEIKRRQQEQEEALKAKAQAESIAKAAAEAKAKAAAFSLT